MAWPPPVQPINLTDATAQQTVHPQIHNGNGQAINDIVARIQANEADAALRRGFNAFNAAEVGIPVTPTVANVVTYTLQPGVDKPGTYALIFIGQTWTVQDYDVRLTVNSTLVASSRISSPAMYSTIGIQSIWSLVAGDVVRVQMAAITGAGGLRAGSNLNGIRIY